jgi:hypothetical protein
MMIDAIPHQSQSVLHKSQPVIVVINMILHQPQLAMVVIDIKTVLLLIRQQ